MDYPGIHFGPFVAPEFIRGVVIVSRAFVAPEFIRGVVIISMPFVAPEFIRGGVVIDSGAVLQPQQLLQPNYGLVIAIDGVNIIHSGLVGAA